MAHQPPKEESVMERIYFAGKSKVLFAIITLPLLISKEEIKKNRGNDFEKGSKAHNSIKIEKIMIYPPIFVIVSNPSIIQESKRVEVL